MPRLASEDERLVAAIDEHRQRSCGNLTVCSQHREDFQAIVDACRLTDYQVSWHHGGKRQSSPVAVIWFGPPHQDWPLALQQTIEQFEPSPVLALLNFPRLQDHELAIDLGAAAVMSKPYRVTDLFTRLDNLTQPLPDLDNISPAA